MTARIEAPVTRPSIDEKGVEQFVGQVLGDMASTMATVFAALGDRLGLFRALSAGAATSDELAARAELEERYVREWASGLFAAGYLGYDPESRRFSLPAEHAAVLADEGGPAFMGGAHSTIRGLLRVLDPLEEAFRSGGGVALETYGDEFWLDLERFTGPDFEHRLVQEWVPAVRDLETRLRAGARVADVGCGTGVAAIKLGQAFPQSTVSGFDILGPNIERAKRLAREAGVEDRVSFHELDAVNGIPGEYDLITFFGVVHDAHDPLGLLRAARAALGPDGICLIQEINSHEELEANTGPIGTVLYGLSLLHCTTQSLAAGGAALGTCGLPEPRLRELCLEAGFASLDRVVEGPLDVLYEAL